MTRIGIMTRGIQTGRAEETTARWVYNIAKRRTDAEFELIDVVRYDPLRGDPVPTARNGYKFGRFKRWSDKIASFDAFIFVTHEYNYRTAATLKIANGFLQSEWSNKAVGLVTCDGAGGTRAVERLRLAMSDHTVAAVTTQILLSLFADFENFTAFDPNPRREREVNAMLDQVISWGKSSNDVRMKMEA